jgi:hypothetical protein
MTDITEAFRDKDTVQALEAYTSLRRSLIITMDSMRDEAIRALRLRVLKAATDVDELDGFGNAAMGTLLLAYASYLDMILWEREELRELAR